MNAEYDHDLGAWVLSPDFDELDRDVADELRRYDEMARWLDASA